MFLFQPVDLELFLASYGVLSIVAFITALLYLLRPDIHAEHRQVSNTIVRTQPQPPTNHLGLPPKSRLYIMSYRLGVGGHTGL